MFMSVISSIIIPKNIIKMIIIIGMSFEHSFFESVLR